jgi:sulfopyruvate decarboxylase TPP-binding subunit
MRAEARMERDALESRPDAAAAWPDLLFDTLKAHAITQVALVPDAGHGRLIRRCLAEPSMRVVTLTTEEEGVAMLLGSWLGGAKGVLLMQSSGVGNCVNMLSLPVLHRAPCAMLVTMRGDFGEFNPAQMPMGGATLAVLEAMGTVVRRADAPEDVIPVADAVLRMAFNTYRCAAALLGQRLLGAKTFGKD